MNGAPTPPVVRHFIPCVGVRCDTTVNPNRYVIEDPCFALRPPPGITYAFAIAELWLFCQFSDATDLHELHIDLCWDADRNVRRLHTFKVNFGTDRLAVRNYALRMTRVPFRRPGMYEFRLSNATIELARATVRLEDAE